MTTLVIFNQNFPVAINPDDVSTVFPRGHNSAWAVVTMKHGEKHLIEQSFEAVLKALSQEKAPDPDASIRAAAPAQWKREAEAKALSDALQAHLEQKRQLLREQTGEDRGSKTVIDARTGRPVTREAVAQRFEKKD